MRWICLPTLALCAGALFLAAPAFGATVIRHYDVNNPASWTGTQLNDISGQGGTAVQGEDGSPRSFSTFFTAADFAAPVYVAGGAGPTNRAYLDFQKFGILTGSNA